MRWITRWRALVSRVPMKADIIVIFNYPHYHQRRNSANCSHLNSLFIAWPHARLWYLHCQCIGAFIVLLYIYNHRTSDTWAQCSDISLHNIWDSVVLFELRHQYFRGGVGWGWGGGGLGVGGWVVGWGGTAYVEVTMMCRSNGSLLGTPEPGRGTHYMKVTTYAPPFRPPFFRSLENLYSFDPFILAKMGKMSYFDPYFSSKLGKMYSFDPPFLTLVAFRVDGRCWASLSRTWPSSPPGPQSPCIWVHFWQNVLRITWTPDILP